MIIIFTVHLSCIHIPSKTHTDRYTVRQADRLIFTNTDTQTQTQRQTDTQADRQTHTQTD